MQNDVGAESEDTLVEDQIGSDEDVKEEGVTVTIMNKYHHS